MNYIYYLQQKYIIALLCSLVSLLLTYIESKYSKQKHNYKYYIKILILVFLNVYSVLYLLEKKIISIEGITLISQKVSQSTVSGGAQSSYSKVDIGNPSF